MYTVSFGVLRSSCVFLNIAPLNRSHSFVAVGRIITNVLIGSGVTSSILWTFSLGRRNLCQCSVFSYCSAIEGLKHG